MDRTRWLGASARSPGRKRRAPEQPRLQATGRGRLHGLLQQVMLLPSIGPVAQKHAERGLHDGLRCILPLRWRCKSLICNLAASPLVLRPTGDAHTYYVVVRGIWAGLFGGPTPAVLCFPSRRFGEPRSRDWAGQRNPSPVFSRVVHTMEYSGGLGGLGGPLSPVHSVQANTAGVRKSPVRQRLGRGVVQKPPPSLLGHMAAAFSCWLHPAPCADPILASRRYHQGREGRRGAERSIASTGLGGMIGPERVRGRERPWAAVVTASRRSGQAISRHRPRLLEG